MVGLGNVMEDESFFKKKQPKMKKSQMGQNQRNARLGKIIDLQQSLTTTYGPQVKTLVNPGKVGSVFDIDSNQFARLYGEEKKQEFDKQTARK